MEKDKIKAFLPDIYKDIDIHIFDVTESTNDVAKALAKDGAPHGCTVLAKEQTKGKGRGDKSFYSPGDTGLYLSIILNTTLPLPPAIYIAVAVRRAIKAFGVDTQIKWVNDLYLMDKKVCGILCTATCDGFIAGVGINITTKVFPDDIKDKAGSLGIDIDKSRFCACVLENILNAVKSDKDEILKEYRKNQMLINKKISYTKNGETFTATAKGVDDNGYLMVDSDGKTQTLSSGEVSIIEF